MKRTSEIANLMITNLKIYTYDNAQAAKFGEVQFSFWVFDFSDHHGNCKIFTKNMKH